MKTIGQLLKEARTSKKISLKTIEEKTKIKGMFILAIEKEKWNSLPAFPTVLGFVKSISSTLKVDEKTAVALLKRDYPPKILNITPKQSIERKSFWNPKMTFVLGAALITLGVLGYLSYQYYKFISPPSISIESPKEGQVVTGTNVLVFGTTDTDAKLTVNNQPVLVTDDGKFSVGIGISPDTKEIVIKAISRSGKESTVSRTIQVTNN